MKIICIIDVTKNENLGRRFGGGGGVMGSRDGPTWSVSTLKLPLQKIIH